MIDDERHRFLAVVPRVRRVHVEFEVRRNLHGVLAAVVPLPLIFDQVPRNAWDRVAYSPAGLIPDALEDLRGGQFSILEHPELGPIQRKGLLPAREKLVQQMTGPIEGGRFDLRLGVVRGLNGILDGERNGPVARWGRMKHLCEGDRNRGAHIGRDGMTGVVLVHLHGRLVLERRGDPFHPGPRCAQSGSHVVGPPELVFGRVVLEEVCLGAWLVSHLGFRNALLAEAVAFESHVVVDKAHALFAFFSHGVYHGGKDVVHLDNPIIHELPTRNGHQFPAGMWSPELRAVRWLLILPVIPRNRPTLGGFRIPKSGETGQVEVKTLLLIAFQDIFDDFPRFARKLILELSRR